MLDIANLKAGDTFYQVHSYYWLYELKVVIPYNSKTNALEAEYVGADEFYVGKTDCFGMEEQEEFYASKEEAGNAFNANMQKREEALKDIVFLLDELYSELETDETAFQDIMLYAKAVEQYKDILAKK